MASAADRAALSSLTMDLIRRGGAGPEVADVQERLRALGVAVSDEPAVFGPATEAAVRTFQQQRGLPADGIVGPDTWTTLVGASYRLGDRILYVTSPTLVGDDVRELQGRLNRLGFDSGYDDGIYGPQTFDAVREFQLNAGVAVDGIAGPATIDQLRRLHRRHQEAAAYVVREREALRRPTRLAIAGTRVMLDPGHSPADPGVIGPDDIAEHEVTWALASLVEGRLAALGAHVVLSRGPTTSPTPSDRAAQANAADVELVLSIHVNGASSPQAKGAAAYYFGRDELRSERGRTLADLALDQVLAVMGTADCRIHATTTAILRETRAPATIIEPGFLSHPEEGRRLADPTVQRQLADALAGAVSRFLVGDAAVSTALAS